jgi:sulfur carrier protein
VDDPTSAVYLPALVHDIVVNGEARNISPGTTVAALLDALGLLAAQVAVERNLEIVPRRLYETTPLESGDTVEIVTFVGGG